MKITHNGIVLIRKMRTGKNANTCNGCIAQDQPGYTCEYFMPECEFCDGASYIFVLPKKNIFTKLFGK